VLVPGLLKEKIRAMARSIPQRLRHKLGSLDEFGAAFCEAVPPSDASLVAALARYIREKFNVEIPVDSFRPDSAPAHLHMNFRVVDDSGRQLGMDRNLAELKEALAKKPRQSCRLTPPFPLPSATPVGPWAICPKSRKSNAAARR